MVFHWSLSDSKSPQVSWTLLSILPVLNDNWYNCHLHVPHFFPISSKVEVFILLLFILVFIFTNPFARSGYDKSFLSPRLVASPRQKNLVCPTILPIAGGRIIGSIPFPRVLVQCEMQSVLSRIWTRVAVTISNDDNHYTTGTSIIHISIINITPSEFFTAV